MTHEASADQLRLMWQRQRREHPVMSMEEVRTRAWAVQAKVRRNLVVALVFGVFLLALCAFAISWLPGTPLRLIASAMMAVTVTVGYKAWKRTWPAHTLSPDAALKGCLEFYRQELEAQYRSAALTWRFLVPIVILTFMMWNVVLSTNPLIPRILLPGVLVLIFVMRRYAVRKFRQKLAAVDEFEKDYSQ